METSVTHTTLTEHKVYVTTTTGKKYLQTTVTIPSDGISSARIVRHHIDGPDEEMVLSRNVAVAVGEILSGRPVIQDTINQEK